MKNLHLPYTLIPYDFQGIVEYRKRHPEEPESSSGEWIRIDELKTGILALIADALDIDFAKRPEPC